MANPSSQVLVIGSGAGGAVTALELARAGVPVIVLEEGADHNLDEYGQETTDAMRLLYRRRGMTPILGSVPIGYVEGVCLGGSTEVNSGFWHRTPREVLLRWKVQYDLAHASAEELEEHFEWAEELVSVRKHCDRWPASTQIFARGVDVMGWARHEIPRAVMNCKGTNACARGCPTGAKRGMSRVVWPKAQAAGARVMTRCRVQQLLFSGKSCVGVLGELEDESGVRELVRIDADHVFVCAGPMETPALLRRSGIKYHVGDNLRLHPMLKVAARFPDVVDAHRSVLPLLQVKEFWPEVSLGGAFFSVGHLAMSLSENWPINKHQMSLYRNMALYYVAVRGTGSGRVRPSMLGDRATLMSYDVTATDLLNLSRGLARLATLLLAAGAEEVFPTIQGAPSIRTEDQAIRWLDELLPRKRLGLTTVHAFSSVPAGERTDRCAADSFGRLHDRPNLYVNDASMLPDSPGVNPQASIMALARRNTRHFLEGLK